MFYYSVVPKTSFAKNSFAVFIYCLVYLNWAKYLNTSRSFSKYDTRSSFAPVVITFFFLYRPTVIFEKELVRLIKSIHHAPRIRRSRLNINILCVHNIFVYFFFFSTRTLYECTAIFYPADGRMQSQSGSFCMLKQGMSATTAWKLPTFVLWRSDECRRPCSPLAPPRLENYTARRIDKTVLTSFLMKWLFDKIN